MGLTLLASGSYTANTGDNTSFRAVGTAISNAFANSGWVQAADAGQINWSTVVANGTASAYHGCEIWRMNDTLANTTPCYLRIDYSNTSGSPNRWGFNITLGGGTNGALGLTGAISSNLSLGTVAAIATTTLYPAFFHGNASSFGMSIWEGWTYQTLFAIERTKDANGADTAAGFNVLFGVATLQQFNWSPWTGQSQAAENIGCFAAGLAGLRTGTGSAFNWWPVYFTAGAILPPMLNWVFGSGNHFATNSVIGVTHYGDTHYYRGVAGVTPTTRSGSITAIPLMRWE